MRIIAGKWKGHTLQTPKNNLTRPTSDRIREALFSALESRIELYETHVLDIFAGTGALGLEALSRGAETCYFIEKMTAAWVVIENNIHALDAADKTHLLKRDAVKLGNHDKQAPLFNLVFLDPPYGKGLAEKTLLCLKEGGWLAEDALLVVEEDKRADFKTPLGFDEINRRIYGDTEITLLSYTS